MMDIPYDAVVADGWDTWLDAWIRSCLPIAAVPFLLVVVLAAVVAVTERHTLRRRFWCALRRRDVEVEFAARRLLSRPCAVLSCSAFEPPGAVACRRRCLDPSYRNQWEPALAPWGRTLDARGDGT